jgi:methane/ammonia monooxygenase subunit C
MAQSQAVQRAPRENGHSASTSGHSINPTDWLVGWKPLFISFALILAADIFLWFWNYNYMFTAGLNSASPEFTKYYRSLFWGEVISLGIFTGIWFGWLIRTGREVIAQPCERAEEVRRIAILWSLIGATSLSIYLEASFWPNWDGSWHQTMVRDTALTPTHIPMFYFFFPLSVTLAVGSYIYGRFRIPAVYGKEKGFPWSFFLLISAAVLECMTVAANEWGHSLWISEEIFSVPFHWPFVVYGWLASGMFAVWGETIVRLFEIEKAEEAATSDTRGTPLRQQAVTD